MKKRWEIEEKDTWKLEDIIPGDQAWEALYEEAFRESWESRRTPFCGLWNLRTRFP